MTDSKLKKMAALLIEIRGTHDVTNVQLADALGLNAAQTNRLLKWYDGGCRRHAPTGIRLPSLELLVEDD